MLALFDQIKKLGERLDALELKLAPLFNFLREYEEFKAEEAHDQSLIDRTHALEQVALDDAKAIKDRIEANIAKIEEIGKQAIERLIPPPLPETKPADHVPPPLPEDKK